MLKTKALYFHTENEAEFIDRPIIDGFIDYQDKSWFVEKTKPIIIHGKFGKQSLYLLKWDTPYPAEINPDSNDIKLPSGVDGLKEIKKKMQELTGIEKVAVAQIVFTQDKKISPEMLKKTMRLSILGNMLKIKKQAPSVILLIIGVIIGVAVMFGIQLMGFRF